MKLPRKGVLIRICIYVPLLLYFGYLAWQKYRAEQAPPEAPAIEGRKHTFTLPDGKSVEVVEITEDQARELGLDPAEARGEAKAPAAGEAKSPAPAPEGAN